MNDNNTFSDQKEINPFSDIEKSRIEGEVPPVVQSATDLGAVSTSLAPEPLVSADHKEDTDLFLQSILEDSGPRNTPAPEAKPIAPMESVVPAQEPGILNKTSEYENLVDLGHNEEPAHEPSLNRTTMQDIVPSDKVTSLGYEKHTAPPSGKKMLIIAGAVAVIVVAIYLVSRGGSSNSTTNTVSTITSPVVQQFASDTMRKDDLAQIKAALIKYNQAKGTFPKTDKTIFLSEAGNVVSAALVPGYLDLLPSDPDPSRKYGYRSDGKDFNLSAVLDDSNDPLVTAENGLSLYKITSQSVESSVNNTNDTSQSVLMENQAGDYVFEP